VARAFHLEGNRFLFTAPGAGSAVRSALQWIFILACIGAIVGFIAIAFASKRLLQLGFPAWLYVILCVIIGPGLVTNTLFKDNWGRARPNQIIELGGAKQFTPALTRSDQCERNCSFVSGEASSFFAIGFAIALLAERSRRRRLFMAAIAAGSFAGLIRIGAGGHFLSDVFFAGIFMALVARGVYWLLFERFETFFADEGPLHRRTLDVGQKSAERLATMAGRLRDVQRRYRDRRPPPS
jgi:lipid A 4'-phosphatase